jgi:uncharacterized membrane protein required for colicin V production
LRRGDARDVNLSAAWPDIVIALILVFTTLKGLRRGMVAEITGAAALVFGVIAAFVYSGTFDAFVRDHGHLGPAPAHVVGMLLYAGLAYATVYVLGTALAAIAKLPLLNLANALLGAAVGLAKGFIYSWALLYVALLFPLSSDVRADLHRSHLVALLQTPDLWLDGQLRGRMPDFLRSYGDPILNHHSV